MKKDLGKLIYEGKAKKIYSSVDSDQVFIEFKNDTTAFNALKREQFADKGRINCQISAHLFEMLEDKGIATHYQGLYSDNVMAAQKVTIIPLEVVLRNVATGSLCRETPIKEGLHISPPLIDFYYKDDDLGDPLLTPSRLHLLNLIRLEQVREIEDLIKEINDYLKCFFEKIDLFLVDFKLEIGVNKSGNLLLADEISPDSCRIWDQRSNDPNNRILDKDRFRKDLGGVVDAYGEILKRIQGVSSKPRNCS